LTNSNFGRIFFRKNWGGAKREIRPKLDSNNEIARKRREIKFGRLTFEEITRLQFWPDLLFMLLWQVRVGARFWAAARARAGVLGGKVVANGAKVNCLG
jgi:hypothetical protein